VDLLEECDKNPLIVMGLGFSSDMPSTPHPKYPLSFRNDARE